MKPSTNNNVVMWKQCFDMKIKIVSNSPKKNSYCFYYYFITS